MEQAENVHAYLVALDQALAKASDIADTVDHSAYVATSDNATAELRALAAAVRKLGIRTMKLRDKWEREVQRRARDDERRVGDTWNEYDDEDPEVLEETVYEQAMRGEG